MLVSWQWWKVQIRQKHLVSQNIHAAMGTILMNSQRPFVLFLNGANPSDSTNIKDSVWLQNLCVSLTLSQLTCKAFILLSTSHPEAEKDAGKSPKGAFYMHQFTPPT